MENCIKSLLPGGNEVEILIVDDGSTKDNTAEIADRYEKEYPGICKAIHQENGGHGAAVIALLKRFQQLVLTVVAPPHNQRFGGGDTSVHYFVPTNHFFTFGRYRDLF